MSLLREGRLKRDLSDIVRLGGGNLGNVKTYKNSLCMYKGSIRQHSENHHCHSAKCNAFSRSVV